MCCVGVQGAGGGRGEKRKFFVFFSNKLSCPGRKEIWVSSVLISIIIIIISSINNALAFNLSTLDFNVQCFRSQEKESTPLLQHATGAPAVTHPYMSIKHPLPRENDHSLLPLLNTRRMGDFLALKIRPA